MAEAVSIITIKGNPVGLDQLASDVRAVQTAQEGVAGASTQVERRTTSVEAALKRLQRQYDTTYRSTAEMERATRTLDRALAQGLVNEERRAELLGLVSDRMKIASAANQNFAGSNRQSAEQIKQVGFQINDLATQVASGTSPFRALAQQGGQLYQALNGPGGVGAGVQNVGAYLRSLITPASVAGTALVGAAALAFQAWSRYDDMQRQVLGTLQGVGRQVGLTADQFVALGRRAGQAGELSVASAIDIANELARTGQLSAQNIERITGLSKQFAATFTGGDIKQAKDLLADLFKAPEDGVQRLLRLLPGVSIEQRRQVANLLEQGERQKAVALAIDVASRNMANYNETVSRSTGAWEKLKNIVSDVDLSVGRMIDKIASIPDKLPARSISQIAGAFGGSEPDVMAGRAASAQSAANRGRVIYSSPIGPPAPSDRFGNAFSGPMSNMDAADLQFAIDSWKKLGNAYDVTAEQRASLNRQVKLGTDILNSGNEALIKEAAVAGVTRGNIEALEEKARSLISDEERLRRGRELELEQARAEGPVAQARVRARQKELELAGQLISPAEKAAQIEKERTLGSIEQEMALRRLNRTAEIQGDVIAGEANSIGMSERERTIMIAGLQAEAQLREQLIPLTAAGSQKYIEQAKANAAANFEVQRTRGLMSAIESAGSSAFSSLAKDLTSGVAPAEALTKALGGVADALTRIGTDSLSKSLTSGLSGLLKGGGSGGFGFDPVSLGIGAVGIGLSAILGADQASKAKKQKQLDDAKSQAEEANRKAEEIGQLTQSYLDRIFMAANAGDDLNSQLARFDYQAMKDRTEAAKGGPQVAALAEQAFALERQKIIDDFNKSAIDATRQAADDQLKAQQDLWDQAVGIVKDAGQNIKDYLTGLLVGSDSPLSPGERLGAARSAFSSQLAAAQGGDKTALSGITRAADALLEAARASYASGSGFQQIFQYVTSALGSLQSSLDPSMFAHFAGGGLVGGRGGTDRNLAFLSRGEFVLQPDAVRRIGLPRLQAMNQNTPGGGSDAAVVSEVRQLRDTVGRLLVSGADRQVRATMAVRDGVQEGNADRRRASQGGPGVPELPRRRVAGRG